MLSLNEPASKNFNDGMHSVVYELICLKLGVVVNTFELYILTPAYMTLTFIQGHRC